MFHTNPRSQGFLHVCVEETALHLTPASVLVIRYQTAQSARVPEPHWTQPSQLQGNMDKFSQCHETGGWGH